MLAPAREGEGTPANPGSNNRDPRCVLQHEPPLRLSRSRRRCRGTLADLEVNCRVAHGLGPHGVMTGSLDSQRAVRQELDRVLTRVIRPQDHAIAALEHLPRPPHTRQRRPQVKAPFVAMQEEPPFTIPPV
jgi:hypothetical protein